MAYFKAPTANYVSTTLNGSINDSVDTITLNDASKLQYPGYIVIDREDGNGTATPNSREVVSFTGISGNDLTGCTRGADTSTARSHSDGALAEAIMTAGMWNNLVGSALDADTVQTLTNKTLTTPIISSMYQDAGKTKLMTLPNTASDTIATIAATQELTNKTLTSAVIKTGISGTAIASGAEVTTGTENTKIVTPKAMGDAGVNTRLKSKIITATRDLTAASGNVSYTGVGFTPTSIHVLAEVDGVAKQCNGVVDSVKTGRCIANDGASAVVYQYSNLIRYDSGGGQAQTGDVLTYDADGFTLAWTKINSPTGTLKIVFMCYS